MRVEITEENGKNGHAISTKDPETGRLYVQAKGDVITVSDSFGALLCGRGWAKDVDGNVPTGERIVRGATVRPKSAKHAAKDSHPAEG
jgi:hypothetical protein